MTFIVVRAVALALATALLTARAVAGEDDFFTHLHTARAMVNVTVSPGRAGPVDITMQLESGEGEPLAAKAVLVTLNGPGHGSQKIQATRAGDDRWLAKISLPEPGRWMLGVNIAIADQDDVSIEAPILIK